MGRSSHEQALQNRSKIVERASKLFRRSGVEDVSVAEVMTATGMTAGGFYKHFASKDALVQEACLLSFEQASNFWATISDKNEEPDASVSSIVRQYFTKRSRDEACPMLAFAAHVASATSGPLARTAYRNGTKKLFTQFVRRKSKKREQEAKVMFAAMIGGGFLAHALGDDKWVRDVQKAVEVYATDIDVSN